MREGGLCLSLRFKGHSVIGWQATQAVVEIIRPRKRQAFLFCQQYRSGIKDWLPDSLQNVKDFIKPKQ